MATRQARATSRPEATALGVLLIVLSLAGCGKPATSVPDAAVNALDAVDDAALATDAVEVGAADAAPDSAADAAVAPACTWSLSCDDPQGQNLYDFRGAPDGATRTCTLATDCAAPLLLTAAQLAPTGTATTADMQATYTVDVAKWPLTVVAGKPATIPLTWHLPPTGKVPPEGALEVTYLAGPMQPSTLFLGIVAHACTVPALAVAPDSVWQHAPAGGHAQATVALANLSCTPVEIVDACVQSAAAWSPVANPCAKPQMNSKYHGLATAFAATALAPSGPTTGSGLLPLTVEFHPPDDNKINANDVLQIVWCATGTQATGDCALMTTVVNLTGNTQADLTPGTLTLTNQTPTPQVGKPVSILATPEFATAPCATPLAGASWSWWLTDRPAGSHAAGAEPWSTGDELEFLPDVAGVYTLRAMMVPGCSLSTGSSFTWTTEGTVTFVVTP